MNMFFSSSRCYWYLLCVLLIILGGIFLFSGYDFAQELRSTRNVIGTDTYLLGKKSALALSFQISGGILLANGLFFALSQLRKDLKL